MSSWHFAPFIALMNMIEDTEGLPKYNIRRFESSIQKFLKVVQIDSTRLDRHRLNFEKFNRLRDWQSLHQELINSSRTLQQIKANLREIDKTREQIVDADLEIFDQRLEDIRYHTLVSVNEFLDLYTHIELKTQSSQKQAEAYSTPHTEIPDFFDDPVSGVVNELELTDCDELVLTDEQLQLNAIPEDTLVAESYENLKQSLFELNDLIRDFAGLVHEQQEKVDRIEDNVDRAAEDIAVGTENLGRAAKLKKAALPVAGAVLGGIIGGPVGLAAGLKIGAAAAVGGGILGFAAEA